MLATSLFEQIVIIHIFLKTISYSRYYCFTYIGNIMTISQKHSKQVLNTSFFCDCGRCCIYLLNSLRDKTTCKAGCNSTITIIKQSAYI